MRRSRGAGRAGGGVWWCGVPGQVGVRGTLRLSSLVHCLTMGGLVGIPFYTG